MSTRPGYTDAEDAAIGAAFAVLTPALCVITEDGAAAVTIEMVSAFEQVAADLAAHIDPTDDPDDVWESLWCTVDFAIDHAQSDDIRWLLRSLLPLVEARGISR